jgi:hypothetical protein
MIMPDEKWSIARSRLMLAPLALAVTCLLGACASSPSVADKPVATTTPLATVTPFPTWAPPTPIADPMSVCTSSPGSRVSVQSTSIGVLDGGWQALPSNLALKPQPGALSLDHQQNAKLALKGVTLWISLNGPTNGETGNVCAVTVEIVSYQPLSAPIPNVTRTCSDLPWMNPGGVETGGDCGAVGGANGRADLVFASTAAGASASSAFHDVNNPQSAQPVQVLASVGQQESVWVHVRVPASGVYVFRVGIWQDRSGPVVFTTLTATFDVNALHEWSGQACAASAMQAKMPPPASPPSLFICPGDPPTRE